MRSSSACFASSSSRLRASSRATRSASSLAASSTSCLRASSILAWKFSRAESRLEANSARMASTACPSASSRPLSSCSSSSSSGYRWAIAADTTTMLALERVFMHFKFTLGSHFDETRPCMTFARSRVITKGASPRERVRTPHHDDAGGGQRAQGVSSAQSAPTDEHRATG